MKQTAVDFIKFELESFGDPTMCELTWEEFDSIIERAKKLEEQQMLDFGSKVTERWGLTKVEPHYIKDEFDKQYKSK